jgi:hypothetical protein
MEIYQNGGRRTRNIAFRIDTFGREWERKGISEEAGNFLDAALYQEKLLSISVEKLIHWERQKYFWH